MSTEAQVAMLMLRLLVDKPKELSKVLSYIQKKVQVRKAELDAGIARDVTREDIMNEFLEEYGLSVNIADEGDDTEKDVDQLLSDEISVRLHGLPAGARFKIG